jgi:uncharacterized cupredoxin-like copper-binding protein
MVDNSGNAPHDFSIRRPGVDTKFAQLSCGRQTRVNVTLQPGTYEVWCSVSNHRQRGMQTTVTVA